MSENSNKKSGGVGFCGMLTILFIGLKLTGNVAWPWLWVLSPLWIPLCVCMVIFVIAAVVLALDAHARETRR
jgi:hypothetical protein